MDVPKNKRTTTRVQYQAMVDKMKKYPDIAKNLTKRSPEIVQHFWESLKDELNSLGPPIKEISEWKKVWSDHKSALKKKLAHNKRQYTDTGGGENNEVLFTELEEDVIQLVCLREGASGVTDARSIGAKRKRMESGLENVTYANIDVTVNEEEAAAETSGKEILNSQKGGKVPKQIKLLEKQINIQTNLYEEVAKMITVCKEQQENSNNYFKKISRSLDRLSDHEKKRNQILQAQLDETKRHNAWMEKLSFDKSKIKKQLLELELNKVNKSQNN